MTLDALKQRVLQANLDLPRLGLVSFTWGNASARDPASGAVVIKASGVPYEGMTVDDLVVVDAQGQVLEGSRRPSSDLPTHLQLYRSFALLGGVVHTHSTWATVWAQAHRAIPALGTTHADYFHGPVPCTRELTEFQTRGDYERETGRVIVERLASDGIDPLEMPAILVASHGPFAWGTDVESAVHHAAVLEQIARMAFLTLQLDTTLHDMAPYLLEKHFSRKHGPGAYYGQR
jgi:L-ribulose-5-phosphate 4-epimerase